MAHFIRFEDADIDPMFVSCWFRTNCPYHDDHDRQLYIDAEYGHWTCFVCHIEGRFRLLENERELGFFIFTDEEYQKRMGGA